MGWAVMMGLGGGLVMVLFFSVWPRVYGRRQLGRIQGVAQAMTVLASAVGPLLLALVRGDDGKLRCDVLHSCGDGERLRKRRSSRPHTARAGLKASTTIVSDRVLVPTSESS